MQGWTRSWWYYVHFSQSVQLGMEVFDHLCQNTNNRWSAKEGGEGEGGENYKWFNCASCVSKDDSAFDFCYLKKKKKKAWLFDQISKTIEITPTNPDSAVSNCGIKYANYLYIGQWLHLSWPRVVRKKCFEGGRGYEYIRNQIFIPNRFILCVFVQLLFIIYWFFFLSKVHKCEVFTNSSIVLWQQARTPSLSLSRIWAHAEVIKHMYSGTYNDNMWTASEIHWVLKRK